MKKLGLIDGIGPESTIPYYHDTVYGVQSKVEKKFFPKLTIESLNVLDELQKRSSIPLVSIIEATCNETKRRNITKVGLLGTIFTMDGEFFKKPFVSNNIEVVTQNDEEKKFVN
jgi:aspartate racemase